MDERKEKFLKQFDYHAPSDRQVANIGFVREGVKRLAIVIDEVVPDGPDKSAAIRKLSEVMMTANKAIVLGPKEIAPAGASGELSIPWSGVLTGAAVEQKAGPANGG